MLAHNTRPCKCYARFSSEHLTQLRTPNYCYFNLRNKSNIRLNWQLRSFLADEKTAFDGWSIRRRRTPRVASHVTVQKTWNNWQPTHGPIRTETLLCCSNNTVLTLILQRLLFLYVITKNLDSKWKETIALNQLLGSW